MADRDSIRVTKMAYLNSGNPVFDYNYGATTYRGCDNIIQNPVVFEIDVTSISGPIEVASCSLMFRVGSGTATWGVRKLSAGVTSWVEGTKNGAEIGEFESGCTYNYSNDGMFPTTWSDGGDWSSSDYGASDIVSTALTGAGYDDISGAAFVDSVDVAINDGRKLYLVAYSNSSTQVLASDDYADRWPYLIVNYSAAAAATGQVIMIGSLIEEYLCEPRSLYNHLF